MPQLTQKIVLVITYDGTDFWGWQKQALTERTVQGVLEKALGQFLAEPIVTVAAGRTDRGGHALNQVLHFSTTQEFKKYKYFTKALNSYLPQSIVVKKAFLMSEKKDFHALKSAESKIYKYRISQTPVLCPFARHFVYWLDPQKFQLDVEKLHNEIQCLVGCYDFKSFQNQGTEVLSTVRHLSQASWELKGEVFLELSLCSDGFLKQMVRNIVGAQLELQKSYKRDSLGSLKEILEKKTRTQAFKTVPSRGLFLSEVKYPYPLDKWGVEI